MELKIEYLPIKALKPYEKNTRKHQKKDVDNIARSIEKYGMCDAIGIWGEQNIIVEGHGRMLACKQLSMTEVPCVRLDHLTDEQRREYAIAHNATAELSEWDLDILPDELAELDLSDFDFDFGIEDEEEETEIVEDEAPEVDEDAEPIAKLGDIWQLGRHRLMCGDSTDKETVELLMDGKKADMVFTDPPYNIGYQGVSDKRTIKNDKMTDEDFVDFLEKALMPCETMYVCCSWQYSHLFRQALENIGQKIKAMIVWDKVNPAQHLDKYFKQHEIIWYCGAFGGEKTLRGDVWQCKRQKNTVHPTMKPLELIGMALQDQPKKKTVYDGFGGSGSTLIACEQLDRTCYMMELDPKYCDVIIKRWETLTGEKAVLLND
jgi:site-specific DNA-methyltransferase (adenine-specific)